jgi:hypothetical protein
MEKEKMKSLNCTIAISDSMFNFNVDAQDFMSYELYRKLKKMLFDRMHSKLRLDSELDTLLSIQIFFNAKHNI